MNNEVELGDQAIDTISNFQGVVIASAVYLHGNPQVALQPEIGADGSFRECKWFEKSQVSVRIKNIHTRKEG